MAPLFLALLACAPRTLAPPVPAGVPGPAHVAFPVDARPPGERAGGGFHVARVPLPQQGWGDLNLRPGTLELIDRTVRSAASELGPDASVEVWVLHHAARRDKSDAHWVSTATGGVAGTVAQLWYPEILEAEATLRVQVTRGDTVVVRDIGAVAVRRMAVARTWGLWSLYRRSPIGEAMTEALLALHADLEADLRTLFHEVTRGEPITAGSPPDTPAQHALLRHWERPDSLRRASAGGALLEAKGYGTPFSVVSGQRITRGEVVGRLGLPLDTLGYDIGLHEDVQLLLDVTVLGVASSATVGVRWRPLVVGDTTLAVEARAGGWLALQYPPARLVLAGSSFGVATVLARTPENRGMTWFARAGVTSLSVNEPVSAFPTLQQGSVVGYALAPGVEAQLTPTTALAVQLTLLAQVQAGRPLTHGIGPFLPVPQLTLGFR